MLIYPCGISECAGGWTRGFGKCSWCWTWIPKSCTAAVLQPAIPGCARGLKPAWSKRRCWNSGICAICHCMYKGKISTVENHFQELCVLKAFRIEATTFPICKLSHAYPFLLLERFIQSAACALAVQQLEDSCISPQSFKWRWRHPLFSQLLGKDRAEVSL